MKESLKRYAIKQGAILTTLCALIVAFATVPIKGWAGSPTGFQIVHKHATRWIVFNEESIDNNTNMIASLDNKSDVMAHLRDIKREHREHKTDLYDLMDDNGNFKSDIKRKMWQDIEDEIKIERHKLEQELDGLKGLLNDGMQFASRQR